MDTIILPLFVAITSAIVYLAPVGDKIPQLALKAFHAATFVTLLVFAHKGVNLFN